MKYELKNGSLKAEVESHGAWLTKLSDEKGDILFPRQELEAADGTKKLRGGCHACLPNFGPGGDSGQPQHGYGRTAQWELADQTDDSILLELLHGEDGYDGMKAELSYQLGENVLVVALDLTNSGETDLRVAPAFHPYFDIKGEGGVVIDGEPQTLSELAEAQPLSSEIHELSLPGRSFALESEGLPVWMTWTDQLGSYVCVEPSVGGFTFDNHPTPGPEEVLAPGDTKTYTFKILWR